MKRGDALGRLAAFSEPLTRLRSCQQLASLSARVRALPVGDRLVLGVLATIAVVAALAGVFALEQHLLVTVPAYGGTLVEGEVGNPRFVNPLLAISDPDNDLTALTYAGLMGLSSNGALVPVLAQSYTVSPDGKTYTFTLRPNTEFSNEIPITAADVVYTVQKAQDPALKSPEYADWAGIVVTAINARTVRFTLPQPYAPFLDLTTLGIMPAQLWKNVSDEDFPFSQLETRPVGAGPFMVSSISRDSSGLITSVTLAANPHYPLGRPYLNGVQFKFYARTQDLAAALKNGAVESAYGVSSAHALFAPYSRVFGVFFNPSENQVYAQPAVRKALSLAINRRSIVQNVLGGYATAIMGPVPPGSSIVQTAISQEANYTAAAAKILEDAGWTYDGSAREWKNTKTKDTLSSITLRTSNAPELKDVALAVQRAWQKLGISVSVELYEPGDLSQNVIQPRKYDALLYGEVIGRSQDLYAFWDSQEQNNPGLNIALYANKSVDTLLEDARTNPSVQARRSDLQQIETTVSADYPAAFLYAPDFVYSVPSTLQGVQLPQIAAPADRFANVSKWYLDTAQVWPFFAK